MPSYKDAFPSKYLKAADLDGGRHVVAISSCTRELIGSPPDDKLVCHFDRFDKSLVLNKINSETIAEIAGTDDYTEWAGTRVELFPTKVEFKGERVAAIRINTPATPDPGTPATLTLEDVPF